jgi:hypothetical protein
MIAEQQDTLCGVPEWEQTLWEEQWLESAKRLSQWELINEYAQTIRHQELLAEASAKIGDWVVSESFPFSFSFSKFLSFRLYSETLLQTFLSIPIRHELKFVRVICVFRKAKSMKSIIY